MPTTSETWTPQQFREFIGGKSVAPIEKNPKYKNQKVEADGKVFDSKKEYSRYLTLKTMVLKGDISELNHHVSFPIVHNGIKICEYEADFTYNKNGKEVVEDVKSKITATLPVYRLKKKLMQSFYGITIQEV